MIKDVLRKIWEWIVVIVVAIVVMILAIVLRVIYSRNIFGPIADLFDK